MSLLDKRERQNLEEAEAVLAGLAAAGFSGAVSLDCADSILNSDARYKALIEQIPAVHEFNTDAQVVIVVSI